MMTQRTYNRHTAQQWQQHLYDQRTGDLSITDYCQQNGLSASNFYTWRSKLSNEASSNHESPANNTNDWLPLNTLAASTVDKVIDITLSLPGGITLQLKSA